MRQIKLFKENIEYTKENVINIMKLNNIKKVTLFFNCFGYDTYYTSVETFATPSGKLSRQGYPRKVKFEIVNSRINLKPL